MAKRPLPGITSPRQHPEVQQQDHQQQQEQTAPAKKKEVTEAMRQRCRGTLGTWCLDFLSQPEVPAVPAPLGNKTCSMDCNKVCGGSMCSNA